MDIKFNSIKYFHLPNGNINILFDSQEKTELLFNGGGFEKRRDIHNSDYVIFKLKNDTASHVINKIKQTDDFDFIMQIDQVILMKIYYLPNDCFENGVMQTICAYYPTDSFYNEILCDFNEGDEINL